MCKLNRTAYDGVAKSRLAVGRLFCKWGFAKAACFAQLNRSPSIYFLFWLASSGRLFQASDEAKHLCYMMFFWDIGAELVSRMPAEFESGLENL
jgi:hypothetical protein